MTTRLTTRNAAAWWTALAIVALAAVGADSMAAPSGPMLEAGRPFPDLVLPALADGRPVSIRDFLGEKVVLHVFASW